MTEWAAQRQANSQRRHKAAAAAQVRVITHQASMPLDSDAAIGGCGGVGAAGTGGAGGALDARPYLVVK